MGKVQVMVVEDEVLVALSLEQKLIELGYDVPAVASSAEEAARQAIEVKPDIILMDIMLSGMTDGVSAAEHIRAELDLPIVYLTAYSDSKTIERAKVTEPFGYLIKPFQERELFATIEMALYKHSMEKKLKASEKWFSTTLKSIGDGVITTTPGGSVTFVNPEAERLTGWRVDEILGRKISEVFRIVSEEARETVENPVERALEEAMAVGLADHTTLIARDGSERPIDDTAAPIVDGTGDLLGAVLVFKDVTQKRTLEKELQRYRDHLQELVDEQTRALIQAKGSADMANRARGEFLANISHDLRTPLNHIIGFTELVVDRHLGELNEAQEEYLNDVLYSGTHLLSLLNDVISLSELETGKITLEDKPFSVRELLDELKLQFSAEAQKKGLRLRCAVEGDVVDRVLGDHDKLKRILTNFVSNSLKFTQEGTVSIRVGYSDPAGHPGLVRFEVVDTGEGIPQEAQARIFESFERADRSTTRRHGGTGLGLAICRSLVRLMGGEIGLDSMPGKGSRFWFNVALPSEGP